MKHAACIAVANRRFPSGYGRSAPPPAAMGKGFTLIELLVVIAIIALLISIILPSLGSARATARTVICQSNLRQLGVAIQGYIDDQKDPTFIPVRGEFRTGNYPAAAKQGQLLWQVGVVFVLQPYLSNSGNAPFTCPSAKGLSSVREPFNVKYLRDFGARFYTYPIDRDVGPFEAFTEYFFNDSRGRTIPTGSQKFGDPYGDFGVSSRPIRLIKFPSGVVWATDALDEFPRHQSGASKSRVSELGVLDPSSANKGGKNNLLFGDISIKLLPYVEYQEAPDVYGAPAPFYNWGHLITKR
jgi:prepilin-type N-terminal cleavage/methylation domain-containing protein